jgi:hypothetical protein
VKISCKEDVHICHTNFAKKQKEICMKQLAGRKHMENDCFSRTLKFEMIRLGIFLLAQWPWVTWITTTTFLAWFWWLFYGSTIAMLETHIPHCMCWFSGGRCFYWLCSSGGCRQGPIYLHVSHPRWYHSTTILKPPSHSIGIFVHMILGVFTR